MKNLKLNEQKIKKVLRRGMVLSTAVFSVVSFSGCGKEQVPNDYPSGLEYIEQKNNEFEKCSEQIIKDGEIVDVYRRDDIVIIVNKDTFEVKEYIINIDEAFAELYDLRTGYLIVRLSPVYAIIRDMVPTRNIRNMNEILNNDNEHKIDFSDLEAYDIESENIKDFYTIEEIRELEPKLVESVKVIVEQEKSNQKVK